MNKDNQLALVSFEQAFQLKAAGFSWKVDCYFKERVENKDVFFVRDAAEIHPSSEDIIILYDNWNRFVNEKWNYYSAPTTALALKWFRDMKGLFFAINMEGELFTTNEIRGNTYFYDTYEEAESALLDFLLKTYV